LARSPTLLFAGLSWCTVSMFILPLATFNLSHSKLQF